jgi:hypothetical protein
MTHLHLRPSIFAAAVLALAANGAAQDRRERVLNNVEVRQLVARAEPADNIRLASHFAALATVYAADAARHTAMSQSYVGNAARSLASGMTAHCRQLSELNTQAAATLRELAVYHEKVASGSPAVAPADASRFHAGAGAPEPNDRELKALAAAANTPAQHRALEEYFLTLAKRSTAEANEHVALANAYRGTRLAPAAGHHDRLAALLRDEAREATDAAAMHRSLAGVAR